MCSQYSLGFLPFFLNMSLKAINIKKHSLSHFIALTLSLALYTMLAVRATVCRHCFYNVYFVSIRVFYHDSFCTVGHSVNNRLLVFA